MREDMNDTWDDEFENWRERYLEKQIEDPDFERLSRLWFQQSVNKKYSYQFDWMGVPIIQMPGDIIMFQEIVWKTRPELIIETGVARGGSLIFWASMQSLCGISGKVVGVDIDIRNHAKKAISASRFEKQIDLIEGSSTDVGTFEKIKKIASDFKSTMVVLDSNHTHEHVLNELELYAKLVSTGCMLLILDTVIDDLTVDSNRPWGPGASPKSAVLEYMKNNPGSFEQMKSYEKRAMLSVAPKGYWKKI
jgi:cephalosporin hydroxylase